LANLLNAIVLFGQQFSEACLPSQCLLCHLPSQQSLICDSCYQATLVERQCCLHCGCGLNSTQPFCGECLKHTFDFNQLHAVASYQKPFPELIKQLKYQHQLIYADLLGLLLASSIKRRYDNEYLQQIDYLIPVPLHITKLRQRGFNQAQLICDALLKHLDIPTLNEPFIVRNKLTIAQEGLTRIQRSKNLRDAFSLTDAGIKMLKGKNIVLIDDVVTTGATINSLCQRLLKVNVNNIDVWCICRTELE
jgi:ComF family protein